jgi:hypothetical protein
MKINNSLDHPRWYDIPCKCNHDNVETEYPITDCLHCKFQECENSLPKENFKTSQVIFKDGKPTEKTKTVIVKEVTIVRGDKYQDIIGWTF